METLFFSVVDRGRANAVLAKAQEYGAQGGTVFLGEGTVQSNFFKKIGVTQTSKEILMISAEQELCEQLHEKLTKDFKFYKRNKGISFTILFKRKRLNPTKEQKETVLRRRGYPYYCLMVIVDKGRGQDCIKAAHLAGAVGGTLVHGRGAGIPANFYFPLSIEPQKDIMMFISKKEFVMDISKKISQEMELDKMGKGIIFTLPVIQTSGIFEESNKEGDA